MLIIACISSHGFGHGSRVAGVLHAVHARRPDCRFILSTALPQEFVARSFAGLPVQQRFCRWDVGVIQADALGSDPEATLAALVQLDAELPALVERESRWIAAQRHTSEAALVLADIPPAAALLAQRLHLPLIWHGNFGWDSIYGALGPHFARWSQQCLTRYRQGQVLLSCPFSLPMPWGLPVHELGLSCATPGIDAELLRQRLDWRTSRDRSALICFGGLGLSCKPDLLESWADWRFLVFDPQLAQADNALLVPDDLRPLDVMPLCDLVITKPGYSTFCEALRQQCGLVVVRREGFAEAAVLEHLLPRYGRHRLITRSEFDCGNWGLDQALNSPNGPSLPVRGEEQAAEFLLNQLQTVGCA